jgi:glycosyltransferase involved in cell wall biosynthesis
VTGYVTVDVAGAAIGGAARYAAELRSYLERSQRLDVRVIGAARHVEPSWLLRREAARPGARRRVALNNVTFVTPGGERWTLLGNALHFVSEAEAAQLDPALRARMRRDAAVVRLTARRADTIVVPCSAMAERVAAHLPGARRRLIVRPHPVSAAPVPAGPVPAGPIVAGPAAARQVLADPAGPARPAAQEPVILCPVLLASYKRMDERLAELLGAVARHGDRSIRVRVTATAAELPSLVGHPTVELVGRLSELKMRDLWGRCRAVYFPTGVESFGYPLAEARVRGLPIIARDTAQNREIAGAALRGFRPGDEASLTAAVGEALAATVIPDPRPFDPDSYFQWLLGSPS